jgi:hypothetical protein
VISDRYRSTNTLLVVDNKVIRIGKGHRPGSEEIPLIDVPNPLRSSIRNIPPEERRSEIDLTKIHLDTLRLGRYSTQLLWLDNAVKAMFRQHRVDAARLASFARAMRQLATDLPNLCGDISTRLQDMFDDLNGGADAILRGGPAIDQRRLAGIMANCRTLAGEIRDSWSIPCKRRWAIPPQ